MKTLVFFSMMITIVTLLSSCVAANNNVRKDYDPPERHHGRFWN